MRTLTAVENVSLDGVMQTPASPQEDTRGGITRGGWAAAALASFAGAAPLRLAVRRHDAFPSGITVTRWAVER